MFTPEGRKNWIDYNDNLIKESNTIINIFEAGGWACTVISVFAKTPVGIPIAGTAFLIDAQTRANNRYINRINKYIDLCSTYDNYFTLTEHQIERKSEIYRATKRGGEWVVVSEGAISTYFINFYGESFPQPVTIEIKEDFYNELLKNTIEQEGWEAK